MVSILYHSILHYILQCVFLVYYNDTTILCAYRRLCCGDLNDEISLHGILDHGTCHWLLLIPHALHCRCGAQARSIAATDANDYSSRSHTIFQINLDISQDSEIQSSKICLVDLGEYKKITNSCIHKILSIPSKYKYYKMRFISSSKKLSCPQLGLRSGKVISSACFPLTESRS